LERQVRRDEEKRSSLCTSKKEPGMHRHAVAVQWIGSDELPWIYAVKERGKIFMSLGEMEL
jgi:hypothetical protein